ncbi:hypothetical protein SCUCBS95973_009906, partial [Sporothrix curviconia]
MTDSFESNLLRLLQAMQEQNTTFATESKKIADRCKAEHGTSTAIGSGAKAATQGEDAEMKDSAAQSTGRKSAATAQANGATTTNSTICRPCYNNFLTLVYQTYAAPARPQWYGSQGKAFLAGLGRRLDDVRALRAPLASIDEWITARFHAWLRSQLQDAVALQTLADKLGVDKDEFRAHMADPAVAVPELLREVVDRASSLASGGEQAAAARVVADVEAAAKKLQATPSTSEKSAIFLGSLFPDGVPDLPAVRAVERKLREGTVGLDEGLGEVIRDVYGGEDEDARAAKTEKHRKRLAEMRRAKAAHEAQKLKKMKPVDVPYFLQDDTPCATCGKVSDPQKSPFCMVCFLEVDYCLRENQTVWCSTTCMKEDY